MDGMQTYHETEGCFKVMSLVLEYLNRDISLV